MFYVQDPRPVLGSLLERKPDLGGIYTQLLELAENKNLSTYLSKKKIVGVFWGLLLFFVEVKHRNGNFVGLNARKRGAAGVGTPKNGSSKPVGSHQGSSQVSQTASTFSQSTPSHSKSIKRKGMDDNFVLTYVTVAVDDSAPEKISEIGKSFG
ncbi:hypothetical protein F5890DRAFT_1486074 [Lentinula detonsa]|uniref:Uncharacterized protein n=1 Tax=Lentinula detonsa TaxID=2804962 RepID=A0AA38UWE0_9AGAR|nr:hypothetical protein F5890DRAFT_1486074 [Lentinula detonsa]